MTSNHQPNRIPSLDGLRAISIILVLFGHLCGTGGFITDGNSISFLGLANLGVTVFFVISGMLITQLLLKEIEMTGRIHLLKFYFRRTFRIFPPYYLFVLALVLMQLLGWFSITSRDVFHTLTYTSNYYSARSWNVGHTWSLSVEEQFYLLWPATLMLLGRRRGLWAACILILLCPLIRVLTYLFIPSLRDGIGVQFETVADSIATGCVLACKKDWPASLKRMYQKLIESPLMILVPIVALSGNALRDHPMLAFLIGTSIANIAIAFCIDWSVTNYEGRIGKTLNSRPLILIGVMSYSIYIWQQIFLNRHSLASVTQFPLNLTLVLLCAFASYYLIERPSLNIRQNLERKWFPSRKRSAMNAEMASLPVTANSSR